MGKAFLTLLALWCGFAVTAVAVPAYSAPKDVIARAAPLIP
jgi:hypothetical protein